jgi:hypothetical protein
MKRKRYAPFRNRGHNGESSKEKSKSEQNGEKHVFNSSYHHLFLPNNPKAILLIMGESANATLPHNR